MKFPAKAFCQYYAKRNLYANATYEVAKAMDHEKKYKKSMSMTKRSNTSLLFCSNFNLKKNIEKNLSFRKDAASISDLFR